MNMIDLAKLKLDPLLKHAKPAENNPGFDYSFDHDPSKSYPAAVKDIIKTIETNKGWTGVVALNAAVVHFDQSKWELIEIPTYHVREEDVVDRAKALELARLWFTEKLHAFCGHKKMYVHALKNKNFKLYPDWYK